MGKKKNKKEVLDESLEIQNHPTQAGIGQGLGDRSSSSLTSPGRTGVGGGVNADDLRRPAFGASDPSLDENEKSYGDASAPARTPTPDRDTADEPAKEDGADRDADEGSADSAGKASFMDIDA